MIYPSLDVKKLKVIIFWKKHCDVVWGIVEHAAYVFCWVQKALDTNHVEV